MPLYEKLRANWKEAGLSPNSGSAAVCMPPPSGFRRVYYLTSAEYAISNIVFRRLKIARFSQLNDPFELLSPRGDKRVRNEIINNRKSLDASYGVLCFSADWTDPVLWSHYGVRHQGICLGFDVRSDILKDVQYQTDRIKISKESGIIDATLADLISRTRFESWRYERECRMMIHLSVGTKEGGLFFMKFDDELTLAEVILGSLCSMNVKEVRSAIKKLHPKVITFKARLAHHSYKVVPDEASVLPVTDSKKTLSTEASATGTAAGKRSGG